MSQQPTHEPQAFEATMDGASQAEAVGELPLEPAVQPGRLLGGRYKIVRAIGAGAMGQVFEARHVTTERRVAVKLLHASVGHDPAILQRFMTEARAAGRARHRNIVEVLDFGADGPSHWMVLEYLDGEALEALVEREAPLAPARVAAILDPLLRAIGHAHAQGFIHRDLKPGNLFLAREEGTEGVVPKVLDFGIAKHTGAAAKLTGTDTVVGTPAYMAPEQVESSRDVTPAADQYAMGCVAYEMLSGRLPVGGETLHGLLINKVTREPEALGVVRPELSPALCACVMRALARDPAKRHPDLEAFRVALVAACNGVVTEAPAEPPAPPPATEAPVEGRLSVPVEAPAPPSPRASASRRGVVLAAVASTALVALGVLRFVGGSSEAPARPTPIAAVAAPRVHPEAAPTPSPPTPPRAPAVVVAAVDAALPSATADAAAVASTEDDPAPEEGRSARRRRHRRAEPRSAEGRRLSVDHHNPLSP